MKYSNTLNLISVLLTFGLIIYFTIESIKRGCFTWLNYITSFIVLFGNVGINILAGLGK